MARACTVRSGRNLDGDHLQFRVSALGQVASGTINVGHDHLRLEVTLPWLLSKFAEKLAPAISREGGLMLEKKVSGAQPVLMKCSQ
jgi:hypothetical protein